MLNHEGRGELSIINEWLEIFQFRLDRNPDPQELTAIVNAAKMECTFTHAEYAASRW